MRLTFSSFRWLFSAILVASIAWMAFTAVYGPETTDGRPAYAKQLFPAPEISLPGLQPENTIRLSDYSGKVVVLNFWASWCPPCRLETPTLEKVYASYQGQDVVFVGINTTYQDNAQDAQSFLSEMGVTYPIAFDQDSDVSRAYLVSALPTTFIIDRDGIIQKIIYGGPLQETLLRVEIDRLLEDS
jgi:thiol-disulfide isomerase/thioredoxin